MPRGVNPYDEGRLQGRNVASANSSNIVSPGIVTDGLVLHLDAGNYNSYPIAGTAWYDLMGIGNNVTLTNGPVYARDGGGSISFDGTNDYADFFAPNLGTTTTVEMWCKIGAGYSNKMFFGWLRYDVWCSGGNIGFNTAASDLRGISSATVTALGLVNNWKHYIFEMRSDVSYTNNKIYINTSSQTLTQLLGTENTNNRTFNSGNGRIAIWRNDLNTNFIMPMNLASFRVYNRALTQAEIEQNFSASRARFGI